MHEHHANLLGFEGVLYTYIPKVLLDSDFAFKPVFKVSDSYSPDYLKHYEEERFDKHDPLFRAVKGGVDQPIDWWGETCRRYTNKDPMSVEVIQRSKEYGIKSGVTLPLLCGNHGIAVSSFINTDRNKFNGIKNPNLDQLILATQVFHGLVQSTASYKGEFVRTILDALSTMESRFLARLAKGKAPSEIAFELNTSERYLEQVMLKMRRKFSGVEQNELPTVNRNQLLYYAGLMDILKHID